MDGEHRAHPDILKNARKSRRGYDADATRAMLFQRFFKGMVKCPLGRGGTQSFLFHDVECVRKSKRGLRPIVLSMWQGREGHLEVEPPEHRDEVSHPLERIVVV